MQRVSFFIDGFNFYHAVDAKSQYHKYKWISFSRLAQSYLLKSEQLADVFYFTTLAAWNPAKVARHRLFIRAQELEGVKLVYGEFKQKQKRCPLCHQVFRTVEEKQTDVNIALALFQQAVLDTYDNAVIVSGDTDLIPAINAVRKTFPTKRVGSLIPIGRASEDLKKQTDFHFKMKEQQLLSSRMNDVIALGNGQSLVCPPHWR